MEGGIQKTSPLFSLKDLTQIALGHEGEMRLSNIAVLHIVIQGILKKLNCENEVVTLSGIKAEELKNLLGRTNHPLLPCTENLKVLTKELDNLALLERKIAELETKLNEHMGLTLNGKNINSGNSQKGHLANDVERTEHNKFHTKACPSHLEVSITAHNKCVSNKLKSSQNNLSSSYEAQCQAESNASPPLKTESSTDILLTQKKAFYQNIKNMKTKATLEYSDKQEENTFDFYKTYNRPQSSLGTDFIDENKCNDEDVLTIPFPEYDLPRAILKTPHIMSVIKECLSWPFQRRFSLLVKKLDSLERSLTECKNKWTTSVADDDEKLSVCGEVLDLLRKVTNNKKVAVHTFLGMQEIFDAKLDASEMSTLKYEFEGMLEYIQNLEEDLQYQGTVKETCAFLLQTPSPKKPRKKIQIDFQCDCMYSQSGKREMRLIHRIKRLTDSGLQFIREQQARNMKEKSKLLRITGINSESFQEFEITSLTPS